MRTLIHLSDLHFGRVDQTLLEPLRELIHSIAPSVVVISGDLTQRARSEEFEAARAFLDTLPGPQIVVPGNHDISLYNVFRRFAKPLDRYKRYITDDLDPIYVDDEVAVVGVNTARSLTIKDGRVNKEQVAKIREQLAGLDPNITRIVVTHHPFDLPTTFEEQDLVNRAPMAMEVFAECGVDVLLAGHMHVSHAASTASRYQIDAYAALVVQAGTATSTRGRGEVNSFNLLRVEHERVEVDRYGWDALTNTFRVILTEKFLRSGNVWAPAVEGMLAAGL
ncbi:MULTISPECIES: metallophosphoesterase [unclassified Massilia]|uniref:metallophosphoesterase family protein n=1 Tax=unclassified Massilia TaxID=2609279 RepID=UPI00177D774E|nr:MULTISPECIES: metallophosphoesterase family protein [unclassified Massilia]MBD8532228.1 metallophosphoesterase [Massilia sp. CFBP 13647]MBD8675697.1 metallophosphoesterase [Massilia sp. CFBP 13721]